MSEQQAQGGIFTRSRGRLGTLEDTLRAFSPAERLILYICTVALGVSTLVLLASVNASVSSEVPARGGTLVEGVVGTPRFVNPLLATSQVDQDLAALVFSGLVRAGRDDKGLETYTPDLADSFEISEDGTVYTFHLRPGLTFHNGVPLTSADVAFTIARAQHPEVKSPRRVDWEGVHVDTPDDTTIVFTLPAAYAPFLENATIGIIPQELWEQVPTNEFAFAPLNTNPIGSGPYKIDAVTLDETGAPIVYVLDTFPAYTLGEANLTRIVYRSYQSEPALLAAFEDGEIDSFLSLSPQHMPRSVFERSTNINAPQSRVFGVFLNQSHASILADGAVRTALQEAVDVDAIIKDVLGGYGVPLDGPIPPRVGAVPTNENASSPDRVAEARAALSRGEWTFDDATGLWSKNKVPLTIKLATADTPELVATAEKVAESWKAAGVQVDVQVYPLTEFSQTILRPRNYDAILFGEVVSHSLDLYPYWHSSQRNDPGLNLALYTNAQADRLLTEARTIRDADRRLAVRNEFIALVQEDIPALFLYAPEVVYFVPSYVHGITLDTLTVPADRFNQIHTWYRDTERVWEIFNK